MTASPASSNQNYRMPQLQNAGTYPYVSFFQGRSGNWHREDATPNSESYAQGHYGAQAAGSFEETDNLSGHKHLKVGQSWHYNSKGHTHTTDFNKHNKIGGSTVAQVSQDHHNEHGGDKWHAVFGDHVTASKGLHYSHGTAGVSHSTVGDKVTDHNDGNDHHNIQGDHVIFIGGVKYENVNSEYGAYIAGNSDFLVIGNMQYTTQNNYFLNAQNNYVLKVQNTSTFIAQVNTTITTPNVYANVNFFFINNASDSAMLVVGGSSTNTMVNSSMIITPAIKIGDPVELVNTTVFSIGTLAVSANNSNGQPGMVLTTTGNTAYWAYANVGTAEPAGSNTWIQINDSNTTSAFATFTFDFANNNLMVANSLFLASNNISINATSATGLVLDMGVW